MKLKFLLLSAFLIVSLNFAYGQQKVKDNTVQGTPLPNKDAVMELESNNKGLLHVRLNLTRTTDASPLVSHIAGMMVYNIATVNDVRPGIYYNDGTKWVSISSGVAQAISYNPVTNQITYTDAVGNPQIIDLKNIVKLNEVETVLNDNGDGTFTYTNEKGKKVTINLAGGASGANGKSMTSDAGVPNNAAGNNGDSYVNTLNGDVYTKVAGVWVINGNIKGATGADGKSIKGGAGTPGAVGATGTTGDIYINTITGDTYINNAGTWIVDGGNLKGPQGATGANGTNGTNGKSLTTTIAGPIGIGNNGDTHINTATGEVSTSNGTTWTVVGNIKGATGANGLQGVAGPAGATGAVGPQGATGTAGAITADNGLNKSTVNNIQLGGDLIVPTTITTNGANTLAIKDLQAIGNIIPNATTGISPDQIVVAGASGTPGVLKTVNAAMPKFFYMPAVVFDTSVLTVGADLTMDLHALYKAQFTGFTGTKAKYKNTGAAVDIPNVPLASGLDYYITHNDDAVINIISIDDTGKLTYRVIGAATASTYMNIVFVIK